MYCSDMSHMRATAGDINSATTATTVINKDNRAHCSVITELGQGFRHPKGTSLSVCVSK